MDKIKKIKNVLKEVWMVLFNFIYIFLLFLIGFIIASFMITFLNYIGINNIKDLEFFFAIVFFLVLAYEDDLGSIKK